jgi:CheY-like chemotaxis protein
MDRSTLLAQAQDALRKLDHPALLQIHPLTTVLLPDVALTDRGSALKEILLDAMKELRPSHAVAFDSPAWRRYRSLFEFYVAGDGLGDVALAQGVSERQTRRDLHQALAELGDYLWARYCRILQDPILLATSAEPRAGPVRGVNDTSWEAEIQRIGALPSGQPIQSEAVVRDVVTVVERLGERLGTRTTLTISDALPAVTVNEIALRQALFSILGWILDARPGSNLTVSVVEAGRGVDVVIQVAGGPGVPIDAGGDSSPLRLGQRLLEIQGGKVEIVANDAKGLRLRLALPSAQTPAILVVDDNPDVIQLFQRYVRSPSVHLVQATSTEQALQLVREVHPRVIILDLMMPVRDGWELLQILTRDPSARDVPIVVCSVVHERSLTLAMGASYFLPKPVSRIALLEVLEQCGLGPMDRF